MQLQFIITLPLLAVFYFYLVLRHQVNFDFNKWKNNYEVVKHGYPAVKKRALLLIPSSALLWIPVFNGTWWLIILNLLEIGVMQALAWWLFFDGWYNLKRAFGWWFNGSHDEADDSRNDILLSKVSDPVEIAIKIVPLLAAVAYYIIQLIKGSTSLLLK